MQTSTAVDHFTLSNSAAVSDLEAGLRVKVAVWTDSLLWAPSTGINRGPVRVSPGGYSLRVLA